MSTTDGKIDDILRKVRALMAQADHPNTSKEESDTFRAKAEALMWKYRIDEAAASQTEDMTLGTEWMTFPACRVDNEFNDEYLMIVSACIQHVDCRGVYKWEVIDDESWYVFHVVGFPADLKFFDLLATSALLAFGSKLEPKYDPELGDQLNAYIMRSAGMEGRRIAMAIYGKDDKHLRPKVRKMFAKEATARGEDPDELLGRGTNVKTYRKSYAMGFVNTLYGRLRTMRLGRGANEVGLVLAGRKERVDEAFYDKFPQYRPKPINRQLDYKDPVAECDKCKKAKSGYCREHSYMRPRKQRGRNLNGKAYDRGSDAARTVDLGGKTESIGKQRGELT